MQDKRGFFMTILESLGKFLPFVPVRWRPVAAGVLSVLALAVGAYFTNDQLSGSPVQYIPATAITIDQQDIVLEVSRDGKKVRNIVNAGRKLSDPNNPSAPAVPVMNWNNLDFRNGVVQTWCLSEGSPAAQQVVRDHLNYLAAKFPNNMKWSEACPGRYTLGATAQIDCGIGDQAAACALPTGSYTYTNGNFNINSGRISYNGNLYSRGVMDDADLRPGLAHEIQHIVMNLGHNDCGPIYDPVTGREVPSVMTPMDFANNSSCSRIPAYGITDEDFPEGLKYYGIQTRVETPNPKPKEPEKDRVLVQRWVPVSEALCTNPSGDWCIASVEAGEVGAWFTYVRVRVDGSFAYPYPFERID